MKIQQSRSQAVTHCPGIIHPQSSGSSTINLPIVSDCIVRARIHSGSLVVASKRSIGRWRRQGARKESGRGKEEEEEEEEALQKPSRRLLRRLWRRKGSRLRKQLRRSLRKRQTIVNAAEKARVP
jgi:hypothetical protein